MIDFVFVNHGTHEMAFQAAQAEVFRMCNPSGGYRLIVADGTGDEGHRAQLEDLGYTVIPYHRIPKSREWGWDGSGQHGQGMDIAMGHIQSDVFCAQDPDHFWVEKDFVTIARDLMQQYVAVAMGNSAHCSRTIESIEKSLQGWDKAEAEGKLRQPSGLVSLMGGTFLRVVMIRQHRLTFEYSPALYRLAGWDEGFLIVNHLEKHHRNDVLWLRPVPAGFDKRPGSFATICYLNGRPFGIHMKTGSLGEQGNWFADDTNKLRPLFIERALEFAKQACQ